MKKLIMLMNFVLFLTCGSASAKEVIKVRAAPAPPPGPIVGGDCSVICGYGMNGIMINGVCVCSKI